MKTPEIALKEIIIALTSTNGRFQTSAVQEAVQMRESITPLLLSILENVIKNPRSVKPDNIAHLYAVFLLAEFREPLAFPLLVKILHLRELEDLFSFEFIIESAHQVLASVFNGDLEALYNIYDDQSLDENSRIAGMKAIFSLINESVLQEDSCSFFIKKRLREAMESEEVEIVTSIVEGISHCNLRTLQDIAEKAIQRGVVDVYELEWNESNGRANFFRRTHSAEKEMGWWACFK